MEVSFTEADLGELKARGVDPNEAAAQIGLLQRPPASTRLDRPATPGDGIDRITPDRTDDLIGSYNRAAASGRCLKFVPASGAASRMFKELLACRTAPRPLTPAGIEAGVAAGDRKSVV